MLTWQVLSGGRGRYDVADEERMTKEPPAFNINGTFVIVIGLSVKL
jgi:hypothetical protein